MSSLHPLPPSEHTTVDAVQENIRQETPDGFVLMSHVLRDDSEIIFFSYVFNKFSLIIIDSCHYFLLLNAHISRGEQDSSPTRQFTDTDFGDSSPTKLKTVHRHF